MNYPVKIVCFLFRFDLIFVDFLYQVDVELMNVDLTLFDIINVHVLFQFFLI
jgi:hypothetical protein